MTEAEWATGRDPTPMLRFLIGTDAPRVQDLESFPDCRTSDRKLRLFACACYHRIYHLLPSAVARDAIEIAERFADGGTRPEEARRTEAGVRELATELEPRWRASRGAERAELHSRHAALSLALVALWPEAQKAAYYASPNAYLNGSLLANPGAGPHDAEVQRSHWAEVQAQCALIRDIFGNPFRLLTFAPEWRTDTAVGIARGMYESRDFSAMPILADALQDAGCDNPDILNHCRDTDRIHVRGCWVVDLVLAKE